jgi:hypothetical protein
MQDDLPEIFEQLKPPAAPPSLRPRVLATVNSELAKRRKPRWEQVLELSVAALLFLGIGINAWQAYAPTSPWNSIRAEHQLIVQGDGSAAKATRQERPAHGLLDHHYARLLVELSEKTAG